MQAAPRGGLRSWAGLLLAIALLTWFVWRNRAVIPDVMQAIRGASVPLLVLAMGVQVGHLALRALRWRLLLAPVRRGIGFRNLFETTVIGYFASTVFPLRVGELVRPLLLASREKILRSATIATVGVERVLDMLTVVIFMAVYLTFFAGSVTSSARSSDLWQQLIAWAPLAGQAMLLAIPALFVVARYRTAVFGAVRRLLRPAAGGWLDRLLGVAEAFAGGLAVMSRPLPALAAIGASIVVWLSIALTAWIGVQAMHLDLPGGFPLQATLLLIPLLAVGVSAPTPGGAGGYHIICWLALKEIFGAPDAGAFAAAWVLWLVSILPMLALGAIFSKRAGIGIGDLRRIGRSGETE